MNVPAHLAASLLETDFANICDKLKAGGTLTTAERSALQKCAANTSAAAPVQTASTPQTPAQPLHLTALPSPAHGDGSVSREQLDGWGAIYGIQHRQLRRMIARGREKGEPCPLDDPSRMPAWVEKHVEKVRSGMWSKVCAAAEAARAGQSSPPPADSPDAPATATSAPVALAPVPTGASIDLALVGGVEGESVELFRRLFAAAKQEIESAYKLGNEDKKRSLRSDLEKLGESLRKHEAAAEAKAKRRGELLSKPEVFAGITEALQVLRVMREQREKRLRARLSDLPPEILDRLIATVSESTAREESVLANLSVLKDSYVLLQLAA